MEGKVSLCITHSAAATFAASTKRLQSTLCDFQCARWHSRLQYFVTLQLLHAFRLSTPALSDDLPHDAQ